MRSDVTRGETSLYCGQPEYLLQLSQLGLQLMIVCLDFPAVIFCGIDFILQLVEAGLLPEKLFPEVTELVWCPGSLCILRCLLVGILIWRRDVLVICGFCLGAVVWTGIIRVWIGASDRCGIV